jgi:hypothetical protein
MKIITNAVGKQVVAKIGYKVRRKSSPESFFSMCGVLPQETLEDFEELSDKEIEAEQASIKFNEEYANLVEQKVREKYSVSAELAILRQRDTKQKEFEAYNTYVEQCKAQAKSELK